MVSQPFNAVAGTISYKDKGNYYYSFMNPSKQMVKLSLVLECVSCSDPDFKPTIQKEDVTEKLTRLANVERIITVFGYLRRISRYWAQTASE